jgi:hypothetical protein
MAYLVWPCLALSQPRYGFNTRVGDRLRGFMYLLRVARLYDKILLFQWDDPAPVETFLSPGKIDWSTHSAGLGPDVKRLVHAKPSKTGSIFDGRYSRPLIRLLDEGVGAGAFRSAKVSLGGHRGMLPLWPGRCDASMVGTCVCLCLFL